GREESTRLKQFNSLVVRSLIKFQLDSVLATYRFNTSAYFNVPNAAGPPGNSRRGAIRGPGVQKGGLLLFKKTPLGERMNGQFRAEAFNVFNHTNFDGVRTTLQSGTFGRIISTRDARIMQLALKFYF